MIVLSKIAQRLRAIPEPLLHFGRFPAQEKLEGGMRENEKSPKGGDIVATKRNRPDKDGTHRLAFEKNKKKIMVTQTVCGICGKTVDKSLRYPHPLSPCIDHIIPVAKGGHPSDLENLQLAHWTCNRQKSDKLLRRHRKAEEGETISNRILPQSRDWTAYRSE